MNALRKQTSKTTGLRAWTVLGLFFAVAVWLAHPVVHAGEGLPWQDSGCQTHDDAKCPLGSLRDQGAPPVTAPAAPAAPLLVLLTPACAPELILVATPIDDAQRPRPPPQFSPV